MAKKKRTRQKPGPKSKLTKKLLREIEKGILEGKTFIDIAKANKISEKTIYDWRTDNYQGLRDKIELWKLNRKFKLASKNLDGFLEMDTNQVEQIVIGETDGEPIIVEKKTQDVGLIRVKANMTQFTLETLGKDKGYSKRNELTGKDGIPLMPDADVKKQVEDLLDEFLHEE